MARKTYTEDQKRTKIAKAVELHAAGESWNAAAKAVGVARLTLANWQRREGTTRRAAKHTRKRIATSTITIASTDAVMEAVLRTSAAQRMMLLKIKSWVDRELAKF